MDAYNVVFLGVDDIAGPEGIRRTNRMMACIISGQHNRQDSLLIELTNAHDMPCLVHSSAVLQS